MRRFEHASCRFGRTKQLFAKTVGKHASILAAESNLDGTMLQVLRFATMSCRLSLIR